MKSFTIEMEIRWMTAQRTWNCAHLKPTTLAAFIVMSTIFFPASYAANCIVARSDGSTTFVAEPVGRNGNRQVALRHMVVPVCANISAHNAETLSLGNVHVADKQCFARTRATRNRFAISRSSLHQAPAHRTAVDASSPHQCLRSRRSFPLETSQDSQSPARVRHRPLWC